MAIEQVNWMRSSPAREERRTKCQKFGSQVQSMAVVHGTRRGMGKLFAILPTVIRCEETCMRQASRRRLRLIMIQISELPPSNSHRMAKPPTTLLIIRDLPARIGSKDSAQLRSHLLLQSHAPQSTTSATPSSGAPSYPSIENARVHAQIPPHRYLPFERGSRPP